MRVCHKTDEGLHFFLETCDCLAQQTWKKIQWRMNHFFFIFTIAQKRVQTDILSQCGGDFKGK